MTTPRTTQSAAVEALVVLLVVAALPVGLLGSWPGALGVLVLAVLVGLVAVDRRAERREAAALERVEARLHRLQEGLSNSSAPGPLRYVNKHADQVFGQVQATINLFAMLDVRAPVPPLRNWAVSPDALVILVEEFLARRPALVVECGSGSSTLFLALTARTFDIPTRIVALDHEQEYADKTNRLLVAHGVSDLAVARVAPLTAATTDRPEQPWYDPAALHDLDGIGLVFVDGPPGHDTRLARYPALPLLWDRLAASASIVLDDTDRDDEQEIIRRWGEAHPELAGEQIQTEKGTYVLRRS